VRFVLGSACFVRAWSRLRVFVRFASRARFAVGFRPCMWLFDLPIVLYDPFQEELMLMCWMLVDSAERSLLRAQCI
jgi:hypothetical protein